MKYARFICLSVSFILFCSCSITKYVPEDKTLLYKVHIKNNDKNVSVDNLKPFIHQTQNKEVLGLMKIGLGFYNMSKPDTSKWVNRWLRKIGEEPVIYDPQLTRRSCIELQRQLSNKGYMYATIDTLVTHKKRKTRVTYLISPNAPYIINRFDMELPDDTAVMFLRQAEDSICRIVPGMIFDLEQIDSERQRIAKILKENGYYYFTKEMLYFTADSMGKTRTIDLKMKMRPYFEKEDSTINPFERRKIAKVTILTEIDPEIWKANRNKIDSMKYENMLIVYGGKKYLRPKTIASKVHIFSGDYYNEKMVERTYASLNYLPPVKYVNIRFTENSMHELECLIVINPDKNHVVSAEIEGTNSDGNFGVGGNINYSHRNLFHGGETFKIGVRGAFETMGQINDKYYNSTELGGNISLNFPQFLLPLKNNLQRNLLASTEINVGYNHQSRPQYSRNIANAGFKYNWMHSNRNDLKYTVDLIDINYIYLPKVTNEFREKYLTPSSSLRYSYEDHFIVRTGFSLTYTTPQKNALQDYLTLRTRIKTAGNLLYGISHLINQQKQDGAYKIFNIRYAQFVKGEIDFSYNKILNEKNKFAFHAALGIAYPYGNANIIPFEERYFSGGANSVRGWSVRTLGPGRFKNTSGSIDFMRQSGDIKMDFSCEYRAKLFWLLEGAVFVDAGNIWTIKEYDDQPEGTFKFNQFYKEIALGYGIGLRLNLSFFIIRLDFGLKLYDPAQATVAERWRTSLTSNDFAFHFAIGYPF